MTSVSGSGFFLQEHGFCISGCSLHRSESEPEPPLRRTTTHWSVMRW